MEILYQISRQHTVDELDDLVFRYGLLLGDPLFHHSNDAGVLASAIPLPPDSIIAAVASSDNVEVVNEDTVMFPGDKAIVVADNQVIDAVRAAFKGL